MNPIDYSGLQRPSIIADIGEGVKLGQTVQAMQDAARLQEMQRQQQLELRQLAANPNVSGSDVASMMMKYPALEKQLSGAWKVLDEQQKERKLADGMKLLAASESGRHDLVNKLFDEQALAAKSAGRSTQEIDSFRQQYKNDPGSFKVQVAALIASGMGTEKAVEAFAKLRKTSQEEAEQPGKLAESRARVAQMQAATGKTMQETNYVAPKAEAELAESRARVDNIVDQIKDRASKENRANAEYLNKMEETKDKLLNPSVKLSSAMEKRIAESVDSSFKLQEDSMKASKIAAFLREQKPMGGALGGVAREWAKQQLGQEDALTLMRKAADEMLLKGALQNLPVGAASNKDVQVVREGFPKNTGNHEAVANWMESFSKVQKAMATREEMQSQWISTFGQPGIANRDAEVNGVPVPRGTTFPNFVKSIGAGATAVTSFDKPAKLAPNPAQSDVAKTPYLKYGQ